MHTKLYFSTPFIDLNQHITPLLSRLSASNVGHFPTKCDAKAAFTSSFTERGLRSSRSWSMQFANVVYVVRVRGLHSSRSWSTQFAFVVYAVHVRWSMTSAEPLHDFCSCFTRCSTKLCRTFAEVLQNIMADSLPLFDFFNSLLWSRMMQKPHIYIKFAERNEPLVLTILNKKSGIKA